MGMVQDMKERTTLARVDDELLRHKIEAACRIIYDDNYAVDTQAVKDLLQEQSLVPTLVGFEYASRLATTYFLSTWSPQSAFSRILGPLGFNHFQMFVVDLMHEFELGVWKALFIHLLRILEAHDKALLHELDRR